MPGVVFTLCVVCLIISSWIRAFVGDLTVDVISNYN